MSLRCAECGEYKVPFGGEDVCGENGCPGDDRDELDYDASVGYADDYAAWDADDAVATP